MEFEKLVYVCHSYGGSQKKFDEITGLMRKLTADYPQICFLSPVHAMSYMTYNENRDDELRRCVFILDMCDEMWTFGEDSNSHGCRVEKEYCQNYRIPIVDKGVIDWR